MSGLSCALASLLLCMGCDLFSEFDVPAQQFNSPVDIDESTVLPPPLTPQAIDIEGGEGCANTRFEIGTVRDNDLPDRLNAAWLFWIDGENPVVASSNIFLLPKEDDQDPTTYTGPCLLIGTQPDLGGACRTTGLPDDAQDLVGRAHILEVRITDGEFINGDFDVDTSVSSLETYEWDVRVVINDTCVTGG